LAEPGGALQAVLFFLFRRRVNQAVKTHKYRKYHHYLEMKRIIEETKQMHHINLTTEKYSSSFYY
jgi:hypothetical protein